MSQTSTSQRSWSTSTTDSTVLTDENDEFHTMSLREKWMSLSRDVFEIIEEQQIEIQSLQEKLKETEEKVDELRRFILEHDLFPIRMSVPREIDLLGSCNLS